MAICHPDGTPYKLKGNQNTFDPNSKQFDLFNSWDAESIRIGGTPMFYYEVFIQSNTVDPLYYEDRGKLWSPVPIEIYGLYEPIPASNTMTTFGIDAPDELMLEFNYQDLLNRIGHKPKIGSRIYTPHNKENWMIKQLSLDVFKSWGQFHIKISVERFQENLTTGEGRVTENRTDTNYKIY